MLKPSGSVNGAAAAPAVVGSVDADGGILGKACCSPTASAFCNSTFKLCGNNKLMRTGNTPHHKTEDAVRTGGKSSCSGSNRPNRTQMSGLLLRRMHCRTNIK